MLTPQEKARYGKQIILPEIGVAGQELISSARVLVIGAGGLGCPILQYLTAAGVGTIGIADGDTVELSNLQRQVLYTANEIGQLKAQVASRKMEALNPHVQIQTYPVFIDSGNVLDIIGQYDLVVDGSDNFATRYLVNDACIMLGKPLVFGAIYKFEGQISVFNYQGGPTYRCIFPEAPGEGESPNCADIGVVATLPGIVGTMQANEVIKMITGVGEVLSGKLLVIDALTMQTHAFHFKPIPANLNITELPLLADQCKPAIGNISYGELQALLATDPNVQLVDVREAEEHIMGNIGGINMPLSGFETACSRLSSAQPVVVYCASGARSNRCAAILVQKGFARVYNLAGGVGSLID